MAFVRGSTGPIVSASGNETIDWPAGSAAADLAVLWDTSNDGDPRGPLNADGWTPRGNHIWTKPITAADLANPIAVQGTITALQVWAQAGGIGGKGYGPAMRVKANGGVIYTGWLSPRYGSALIAAATYRLGTQVVDPGDFYRHAMFARTSATAADLGLDGVHRAASWFALEVLPLAAPLAPEWEAPASGAVVDVTSELTLDFLHRSASGSDMDAARVTVRPVGGSWSWVKSDGTLSATQVDLVQAVSRTSIDAGVFSANVQLEAQSYTHDLGGWSPASPILPLTTRTPPVTTATLTTAAGDVTPTVGIGFTPGFGSMQSWEVALADASDATPSSPLVSVPMAAGSASSWTPSPADVVGADGRIVFTNGQSIRAWVRGADSALTSAWAYSTPQPISWTPPPAPSSVTFVDGAPAKLVVAGIPAGSVRLTVEWETSTGVWVPVVPTLVGAIGSVDIPLPHAPFGVARAYRVASLESVDGVLVPSTWVTIAAAASTDLGSYFVSLDGADWLAAPLPRGADMERERVQGVSTSYWTPEPDSSARPVAQVDSTPAAGWAGALALLAFTEADAAALVEWITTRESWWWRPSPEKGTTVLQDTPTVHISRRSGTKVARRTGTNIQLREVRFEWVECE